MPFALTIAGSDSGGGAGIQADLKTFQALGCYGMSVLTALTAQNTVEVRSILPLPVNFLQEQLDAVLSDLPVDALKIGMLHSPEVIETVSNAIQKYGLRNIVLDPVMVAKSGDALLRPDAVKALTEKLLPLASIVTPNIPEAEILSETKITTKESMEEAAHLLVRKCKRVLVKGGHGSGDTVSDLFLDSRGRSFWMEYPRVQTKNTHGTGCTFSSAIAAYLARGESEEESVRKARLYLQGAIEHGANLKYGKGHGPVSHGWNIGALK